MSYVRIGRVGVLAMLAFTMLAMLGFGCAPERQVVEIAGPVFPDTRFEAVSYCQTLLQDCAEITVSDLANIPSSMANELVVLYANSGRDMFEPEGPDGYVVRVIPLRQQGGAVDTAAEITVALYRELPSDGTILPIPVKVWFVPIEESQRYWFPTQMLDGFLFRLAWSDIDPGLGRYRMVVRLNYKQLSRPYSLCGYVDFIDRASRALADDAAIDDAQVVQ